MAAHASEGDARRTPAAELKNDRCVARRIGSVQKGRLKSEELKKLTLARGYSGTIVF